MYSNLCVALHHFISGSCPPTYCSNLVGTFTDSLLRFQQLARRLLPGSHKQTWLYSTVGHSFQGQSKRGITLRQSLHPMKFSFIGEIIISFKRTRWVNNFSSPMVMSITFFFFTLSVSLYFHSHHFQFLFSFNPLSSEVLAVRAFLDAGTPLPRMAQACLLPSRVQNICFSLWNSCRYEVKSFADGPDISSWIGYWEPQQNLTLLTLLVQFCKYQPYFGFKTSLPRKQVLRNRRKCIAPRTNTETSEQYHRK